VGGGAYKVGGRKRERGLQRRINIREAGKIYETITKLELKGKSHQHPSDGEQHVRMNKRVCMSGGEQMAEPPCKRKRGGARRLANVCGRD